VTVLIHFPQYEELVQKMNEKFASVMDE